MLTVVVYSFAQYSMLAVFISTGISFNAFDPHSEHFVYCQLGSFHILSYSAITLGLSCKATQESCHHTYPGSTFCERRPCCSMSPHSSELS